jgi:hypothetical protein
MKDSLRFYDEVFNFWSEMIDMIEVTINNKVFNNQKQGALIDPPAVTFAIDVQDRDKDDVSGSGLVRRQYPHCLLVHSCPVANCLFRGEATCTNDTLCRWPASTR